jgi:predicted nucleic acid-binding Zn ribbon protein
MNAVNRSLTIPRNPLAKQAVERTMPRFQYDEDDAWEDEYDGEESLPTIQCPYCNRAIYDDSVRCPHCENYISQEDAPSRPAAWIAVGVVICLAIVFFWIFLG